MSKYANVMNIAIAMCAAAGIVVSAVVIRKLKKKLLGKNYSDKEIEEMDKHPENNKRITKKQIQKAVNDVKYDTTLEYFVMNNIQLSSNQLSALQEKSSAWNRYLEDKGQTVANKRPGEYVVTIFSSHEPNKRNSVSPEDAYLASTGLKNNNKNYNYFKEKPKYTTGFQHDLRDDYKSKDGDSGKELHKRINDRSK